MEIIRVLVVDDSAFMRKLIRSFLDEHPRITVIDTARNGQEAVEKAMQLQPDVITMDVEMPVKNGLDAVSEVMEKSPCAIIMLSSVTKKGAELTLDAMQRGAMEVVQKPSGSISLDLELCKDELIEKVLNAPFANPLPRPRREQRFVAVQDEKRTSKDSALKKTADVVLIGTSTGGPKALSAIIPKLPKNFPVPICIVQHMPPGFTDSLAKRLNMQSELQVKEASHGELMKAGSVYIAPGGKHVLIEKVGHALALSLSQTPVHKHCPSVDVLYQSAANIPGLKTISVILTGMGKDGLDGVKALRKQRDHYCIAQSKRTSVIHGMPGAIIQAGLHDDETDLEHIARTLCQTLLPAGGRSNGNEPIS
ncbi:chemotaxis response regulator protein-glutamate methylesterase [Bacillaceae bacterium SIJ1]|uniref:protein-glutamate methylesterase/protein-glutamine glutaminase n=1 Tax=Litoribacterium kuwaitense TaxID=1398745 RepID=UPI0013EB6B27|nr:chemotaxis response regulator protein-glutamate methylesterase [Litoribacterium kuwaitense]NGP44107.1 chemotaxis response regulator protein-glutamate methylesterase [Litoribacterium kuwaitense]